MGTPLTAGFYLGVSRRTRNFSFTLPKKRNGASEMSMPDFWDKLLNGSKPKEGQTPVNKATNEKTTSFSGWTKVSAAKNLSDKCFAAPDIYKAAGGDDYKTAEAAVKKFKQHAASVLGKAADEGTWLDESTERAININACQVHEIKVILLRVSDTEAPGLKFNPETNLYYGERVMRKFYISALPLDSLLISFRDELADPGTNVCGDFKLRAVRNDKVTLRTGRNASTSAFRIVNVSDLKESDDALRAARDRILAKIKASQS